MDYYSEENGLRNSDHGSGRTVIFLRELYRDVDIGIHAHEIGRPQKLRFDIEVIILNSESPKSDKISDVVNYEYLLESIDDSIRETRVSLLLSLIHI